MHVRIQEADFDVGSELAALRRADPRIGALASFVGLVRDVSGGAGVSEMSLEHYPGMTEKALAAIVGEALQRWSLIDVLVIHRVGRLLPTEQIVLVAVAAAHRAEAFAGCEFIMDYLKTRAPFWKRELTPEGARWVEARDEDDRAAERWRQPGG
ncbi:MAG: Molybdopterin synthase catalytic subunit [Accumulibacter sp.]|uniref:molybdopterin synthase catalytic subunit MoaE n=1 Tax=Accumulibacter sp. TaxID=2053492 RepID=UPI0011F5AA0D|nr:molybdopterin synthase catalytic subunit MoaE [Accumulibacter sp.]QKS28439.1 MAG: molybdopterin synthase catalytic subunit MoaE [Candidatus Accumulibacter similis]TLD45886.1 MAG: Molybdopterin synthase catalytic subunit [Accumulibacter sp.]